MKYAGFLKPTGTIGIVAPSFGAAIEPYASRLTAAVAAFEQRGYTVHEYACARKGEGVGIAAAPTVCAQDFMEAYCDAASDVLISAGGGELACEVLSHLDFKKLSSVSPKWFMGYSDNTNVGFLLTTLTHTASIYAPCAPTFGMKKWHPALQDAFDLICGNLFDHSCYTVRSYAAWEIEGFEDESQGYQGFNTTEKPCMEAWIPAIFETSSECAQNDHLEINAASYNQTDKLSFSGRLLVGCMDCLDNLIGTRFDKVSEFIAAHPEGIVWALEACELSPMGVRRSLWHMKEAGWFERCKGIVMGRPGTYGQVSFGLTHVDAVIGALKELQIEVPVVLHADFGHLPPSFPLVCGSLATVSFEDQSLEIKMQFV